jgi:hypothetical protein
LTDNSKIYRILDANINRLREALRVIEEYYRFICSSKESSISLKDLRHALVAIEKGLGPEQLLAGRDTSSDCFADENRPVEMNRESVDDIVRAGFKRAQEAARVIEEYAKFSASPGLSLNAKKIRFALYEMEKQSFLR